MSVLLLVLSTCAMAAANKEPTVGSLPARKLAQATVAYYDKSKCTFSATQNFDKDAFTCDKSKVACCGPSSNRCYADPRPRASFKCKNGDSGEWCCLE